MNRVNPRSFGLSFGLFLAAWHAFWSLMVAVGVAQWFMDLIFKLHMITPPYQIAPFNLGFAVGLVLVTGVMGYIFGWVLGVIWNRYAAK